MAISLVGTVALQGSTTTQSLSYPAGIAADDIAIIFAETSNESISAPTDYSAVNTPGGINTPGASGATRVTMFWKRLTGSETSESIADAGDHTLVCMAVFRGCIASGSPIGANQGTGSSTSSTTSVSISSFDTTAANSWVVACSCAATNSVTNSGQTWTNPTGLTERIDAGNGAGNGGSICVVTAEMASAGATGTYASTQSLSRTYEAVAFELLGAAGDQTLTPSLFTNSQTFYSPTVTYDQTLTPSLFTNTQTFHAATVSSTYGLTPSLFTNSQSFFSPTVAVINDLTPALFTNSPTFYAPTVAPGAVDLTPSLFTNSQTFYAATVVSVYPLTPSLFTNSQTFHSPTVAPGPVTLTPSLFTNTQTFYTHEIALEAVNLTPSLFTNSQTFYAPEVLSVYPLEAPLVSNTITFYGPAILQYWVDQAAAGGTWTPVSDADGTWAPVSDASGTWGSA